MECAKVFGVACIIAIVLFSPLFYCLITEHDFKIHRFTKEDGSAIVIHGRLASRDGHHNRSVIRTKDGKYVVVEKTSGFYRIAKVWECKKAIAYPKDLASDEKRKWRATFKRWSSFDKDPLIKDLAQRGDVEVK